MSERAWFTVLTLTMLAVLLAAVACGVAGIWVPDPRWGETAKAMGAVLSGLIPLWIVWGGVRWMAS